MSQRIMNPIGVTRRPLHHLAPLVALASALTLGGCGSVQEQRLVLTGSSTVEQLATPLARAFEAAHPGVRVAVQTGGSSRGIADALAGTADLGMASRTLKGDEHERLVAHTIARDGIALIVHRDNPVAGLSAAQVIGIYTGTIADWQELGGTPGTISVTSKASGRATLEVFCAHFGLSEERIQARVIIGENLEAVKTVSGNPQAIAFLSIGTAEQEITAGSPIRLVVLDGVAPSTDAVAGGAFPLYRPLNLLSRGEPSTLAQRFIAFAHSEAGRTIIREAHFVPVRP